MRKLLLSSLLLTRLAHASDSPIIGSWEGADTAAMSIYGIIKISPKKLVWGDFKNKSSLCSENYVIVKEPPGVKFRDQTFHEYVTAEDSDFSTFLLKISHSTCQKRLSHLRMTVRREKNVLDLVEYEGLAKPGGWMHFVKDE